MKVLSEEITKRLQEETGLTTDSDIELMTELIETCIKKNKSQIAIELYIDIMTQGRN